MARSVTKGMNGDRGMPQVEDSGGQASAMRGLPGSAQLIMAMPNAADDDRAMLVKGEARVESSTEVMKGGKFGDEMKDRLGEPGANGPMDMVALAAEVDRFTENHSATMLLTHLINVLTMMDFAYNATPPEF